MISKNYKRIAVIGADISGIAAANVLKKNGYEAATKKTGQHLYIRSYHVGLITHNVSTLHVMSRHRFYYGYASGNDITVPT
ncbi:hypothetical protein NIES4071_06880 [Calothrix sp. NIES-4071]|nr:hypothetical protein NIES4071_06880 [Calothrix sp. NIES-4071]BAZ55030.1 hypothetical protein NIES4105_06840 [Calothrix sp. NIES-4105]